MEKRNEELDLVKGIGILLMVYGHAVKDASFIALFHMSLFFITSGYLFKPSRVSCLKGYCKFVWSKLRSLWVPYTVYGCLFVLLHNVFVKLNVYSNNPDFLLNCSNEITKNFESLSPKEIISQIANILVFQGDTQIGGALWFLQCLFYVLVLYGAMELLANIIFKYNHKNVMIALLVVALVFLLMGGACQYLDITAKHMNRVFSCYWMIWIGNFIRVNNIIEKMKNRKVLILAGVGGGVILRVLNNFGRISLNGNMYPNALFLIVCSISGFLMIYSISYAIRRYFNSLVLILQYLSIHSIPIIALHFLFFKMVNCLYIYKMNLPHYMIAAFPTVTTEGIWWILYCVVGIAIPLLFEALFNQIVFIFKEKVKK